MRPYRTSRNRRGTVTVVVVAFLALLLIMGLSFAFYALRESEESRVYRDSVNGGQTGVFPTIKTSSGIDDPPEPDTIANRIFGDVIYDPPDDLTGAFNVLRGHGMARSIYGWNPKFPTPYWPFAIPPSPGTFDPNRAAIHAFNGIGRVSPAVIGALPPNMINFAWVPSLSPLMYDIDNNYARDPRAGAPQAWIYNPPNPPIPGYLPAGNPITPPATDRYWAKNADYTYPDENNFFLAAIDPTSGRVLVQSYHRPWLINGARPKNPEEETPPRTGPTAVPPVFDPADTNSWTNAAGRLQMLRPRPVDHQWPPGSGASEFRYPTMNPDGSYADVELLAGKSIGRYLDAQWLDPDLPVRTWRGKSYKPLVAMLILDLDGRINLNTAGNFYPVPGTNPPQFVHGSNQGIGPWEVNPTRVLLNYPDPTNPLTPMPNPTEASRLTLGTPNFGHARYGVSWMNAGGNLVPITAPIKQYVGFQPNPVARWTIANPFGVQMVGQNQPPYGSAAHFYSGVDFLPRTGQGQFSADDTQGHATNFTWGWGNWGQAYVGQVTPPDPNNPPRPHPNNRFGNGYFIPDPNNPDNAPIYDERSDHPFLFNPYLLRSRAWLDLNPGTPASPRVIANRTFGVEELRHLNAQFDFSISPSSQLAALAGTTLGNPAFRYFGAPVNAGQLNARFVTTPVSNDFDLPGSGPANIAGYQTTVGNPGQPVPPPRGALTPIDPSTPAIPTASYDDSFRTRLNSLLGPVDITRKLTEYRASLNSPLGPGNIGNWQRAISDRQLFARDIFQRLRLATGLVTDPNTPPPPGDPTSRWLAQVAVNIVDFIDNDDCITPFKWTDINTGGDPNGLPASNEPTNTLAQFNNQIKNDWVFGFERPRANINEAYLRIENDKNDPLMDPVTGAKKATMDFDMLMWLELHNPLTPDAPAQQFTGTEAYSGTAIDDNAHGGYRAALKDSLQGADKSVYRVLVYKVPGAPGGGGNDPLGMRGYDNVAGVPSNPAIQLLNAALFTTGGDTVDTKGNQKGLQVIEPNVGAQYRDDSFFLAGPQLDQQMGAGPAQVPTTNPQAIAELTTKALQAKVNFMTDFLAGQMQWAPGFVLQRLACPALPPGQNNPYVTIDYFESDPTAVNNRLKFDGMGNPGDPLMPGMEPDWSKTYSWGRRQPYDGVIQYTDAQHYQQKPGGGAAMGQINFTMGQHNGGTAMSQNQWPQQGDNTLQLPFNPLAHYDRIALSPAELFHVVGTKPHELTHEFRGPPNDPNQGLLPNGRLKYTVDWLDHGVAPGQQGGYLYRALGLLRSPTPILGLGMGGRVPGKININTIFNQEVFNAICDAQAGINRFQQSPVGTAGTVDEAWTKLVSDPVTGRQPGGLQQIGPNDKPLRGYAISSLMEQGAVSDRNRTPVKPDMLWSQTDATQSKEDYRPGPSPAGRASALEKYELLSKVYNQFTTRSNTFAVYMMIGYFEVRNPGPYNEANRPVLGKELGFDDGTIVRHKYFAVIDRTNLTIEATPPVVPGTPIPPIKQGQAPVYFSYQPYTPVPNPATGSTLGTEDPGLANPPQPVKVVVPAIGQVLDPKVPIPTPVVPSMVSGQYDGTLWTIVAGGSQVEVDVGERKETLTVLDVIYDPLTNSAILTILPTKMHTRGVTMRLTNPDPSQPVSMPGNPGPQPGFNFKSPRYAPVVKYVEQLR